MQINKIKILIILRMVLIAFNLLAFAGSIVILIHPISYLFMDFFGFAVLLALIGNIVSAYFNGTFLPRHRYSDYCYLLLHIICMLLIPVMNTFAASGVQNKTSQSVFVHILFIIIFLFGAAISVLQLKGDKNNKSNSDEKSPQSGKLKNVMRWVSVILLCINLFSGICAAYIMFDQNNGSMTEVFISEYAVFYGLSMLASSVLIMKLRWRNKKNIFNKIISAAGILIFAIFLIQLFSIPSIIRNADAAYREAFGDIYLDKKNIIQIEFMKKQFSLQDYLFSKRTRNYIVEENVLFYEEPAGVKLYFDVYMPLAGQSVQNSVLIRIHGGAWTVGDKGFSNYSATNKHFVNLGYVVFDIQYGLSDQDPYFAGDAVPANVKGNFDIDDMVRHIGIFTSYLAGHADEYGANMDSVFISGASAGGQLAIASALGISGGRYTDILDSRLNVKGIIPFYPANGLSPKVGIGGTQDLVDPAELVDENSPPCLIYHGTHDGIVPRQIASIFQQTYREKSNAPCALLWMNFAGHGSDIYTPGYYNQIFMYYMERFMQQYK